MLPPIAPQAAPIRRRPEGSPQGSQRAAPHGSRLRLLLLQRRFPVVRIQRQLSGGSCIRAGRYHTATSGALDRHSTVAGAECNRRRRERYAEPDAVLSGTTRILPGALCRRRQRGGHVGAFRGCPHHYFQRRAAVTFESANHGERQQRRFHSGGLARSYVVAIHNSKLSASHSDPLFLNGPPNRYRHGNACHRAGNGVPDDCPRGWSPHFASTRAPAIRGSTPDPSGIRPTRLVRVTFANETASGWQTAVLASSIRLTVGATYVVSYNAPVGRYSYTPTSSRKCGQAASCVHPSRMGFTV